MIKKDILLSFNYARNQWVKLCEPFFKENNIHWLSFITAAHDNFEHIPEHEYHYWSNYRNSQEIINELKPEVIIIMDNLSPLTISLIYQAKINSIPVCYLQHGVYSTFNDYLILERAQRKNRIASKPLEKHGFSSLNFVKASIPNLYFKPKLLSFLFLSKIVGARKAAYLIKEPTRVPDLYLCYDDNNATLHRELDGISHDKIRIIGNPELELFSRNFEQAKPAAFSKKYWLLIDQALSGSDIGEKFISRELHLNIYYKLAELAQKKGFLLVIKLHPGDYTRTDLLEHENIKYIKASTDLISLVKGSNHCIGFWSALLSSVVYFKTLSLIKLFNISFYERMRKNSNVRVYETISNLDGIDGSYDAQFTSLKKGDIKYAEELRAIIKSIGKQ